MSLNPRFIFRGFTRVTTGKNLFSFKLPKRSLSTNTQRNDAEDKREINRLFQGIIILRVIVEAWHKVLHWWKHYIQQSISKRSNCCQKLQNIPKKHPCLQMGSVLHSVLVYLVHLEVENQHLLRHLEIS